MAAHYGRLRRLEQPAFESSFSAFCSDPGRKKWHHPHAAVLRDFWPFNPLQVDKSQKASILY